jgi:predicted nucleotidyltransferase
VVEVSFYGYPLKVVSAEDLILFKLIAFRPQDQEDIRALLAIKGRDGLRLDYIRQGAARLAKAEDPKLRQLEDWIETLA